MKNMRSLWMVVILAGCSHVPVRSMASAIVAGRVIDANGAGVAAAWINLTFYRLLPGTDTADLADSDDPTCGGRFTRGRTYRTGASGYFRELLVGGPPFLACIVFEAVPPAGSEWASAEAAGGPLYFRSANPGDVVDSVNVTIRLPRR